MVGVLIASCVAVGNVGVGSGLDGMVSSGAVASESPERLEPPSRRVDLAFVGDIHTLRRVNYTAQRPGGGYDYRPMFADVAPLLESFDMAVCHMEAPIAPPGTAVIVVPPLLSNAAPLADALADGGFTRCSTAGNHILDRGVAGIDATLNEFDRVGLTQSGAARSFEESLPASQIVTIGGIQVAHLSYSWAIGGQGVPRSQPWRANKLDPSRVIADARTARAAGAEVVAVSFTWGFDKIVQPTSYQRSVARQVTASGEIDLIVGQQAHVMQPIERVNGVWVAYGMGNFLSDHPVGSFPPASGDAGIFAFGVEVDARGGVTVERPIVYPTWIDKYRGHVIRPVSDRHDPFVDASIRRSLDASLLRTLGVVGDFVAAGS